jgi:hypothetical protein
VFDLKNKNKIKKEILYGLKVLHWRIQVKPASVLGISFTEIVLDLGTGFESVSLETNGANANRDELHSYSRVKVLIAQFNSLVL